MKMKRVENIEDRVDHVLQLIVKSGERRDRLLTEVTTLVDDHHGIQSELDAINEVRYQLLQQYLDRGAALARTIESSAALAERSSRRVKRLDAVYSRVQAARLVAESTMSMRRTVAEVPAALATGHLDSAVALITQYGQARRRLVSRDSIVVTSLGGDNDDGHHSSSGSTARRAAASSSSSPSSSVPAADPIITVARRDVAARIALKATAAMSLNDKLTIMECARLLAELGLRRRGMDLYFEWMCEHTMAAIKKMVDRELRKMNSPTKVAMSHLALVSQALDTVAAAYEAEEEFALGTFGHAGPLVLLSMLHVRATAECVPVLRDFIGRRRTALEALQRYDHHGDDDDGDNDSDDDDDDDEDGHGAWDVLRLGGERPPASAVGAGVGVVGGPVANAAAAAAAADSRRADQTLEETSHLVSCCHIYLDFADSRRAQHLAAILEDHARSAASAASTSTTATSSAGSKEKENDATTTAAVGRDNASSYQRNGALLGCTPEEMDEADYNITNSNGGRDDTDATDANSISNNHNSSPSAALAQAIATAVAAVASAANTSSGPVSAAAVVAAADRLWSCGGATATTPPPGKSGGGGGAGPTGGGGGGGSNALLDMVQEILALYVPLQNQYFTAAFRQTLQLQLDAISSGVQQQLQLMGRRLGGGAASPLTATASHGGGGSGFPSSSPSPHPAGAAGSPTAASLMSGLTNIYSAALGGSEQQQQAAMAAAAFHREAEGGYYLACGGADGGTGIKLPDDVFFLLRIAAHRALNTKSTQIASAVILSACDLVQSQLIPEIAKRAVGKYSGNINHSNARGGQSMASPSSSSWSSSSLPPTPRALRWACAAYQVAEYCKLLAHELRAATGSATATSNTSNNMNAINAAGFSHRDAVRFRELSQDLDIAANTLRTTAETRWMASDAALCVAYVMGNSNGNGGGGAKNTNTAITGGVVSSLSSSSLASTGHRERVRSMSYNITEEVFYHYELNDPWVRALLVDWAAVLDYVAAHLVCPPLFDALLVSVARAVAAFVREAVVTRKMFSTFGALQADKDVRVVREFFLSRTHECASALREVFAPLSLASTLLLCDNPRDALEEGHNHALTAEEKRQVLLLRVDFKRQDVLALRL